MSAVGKTRWAVAGAGSEDERGRATIVVTNFGASPTVITILVYFEDREPSPPLELELGARRVRRVDLEAIARGEGLVARAPYTALVQAQHPVVVFSADAVPAIALE